MKLPVKETKKITEDLVKLLGVDAEVDVQDQKESLSVSLDSEKYKGLLIGYRGETLNAIQSFVAMALKNKTREWY